MSGAPLVFVFVFLGGVYESNRVDAYNKREGKEKKQGVKCYPGRSHSLCTDEIQRTINACWAAQPDQCLQEASS